VFAFVANTFTFVRFRLADGANLGGKLTDLLPIDPFDDHVRLVRSTDIQTGRYFFLDFVGKTDT